MLITRRIQFCAGHRLINHEGPCRNLHGHNYVALFSAQAVSGDLDHVGRVVDFSVLKERMGGWIDRHWDHKFLLCKDDLAMIRFCGEQGFPVYSMTSNPTAEVMAEHLLREAAPGQMQGTGVRIVSVKLWETENCFAEACL